jgi:hypothetical protein
MIKGFYSFYHPSTLGKVRFGLTTVDPGACKPVGAAAGAKNPMLHCRKAAPSPFL